jgi:hypothetical protein
MPRFDVRNRDGEPVRDHTGAPTTVIAPDEAAARKHAAILETLQKRDFILPETFTAEEKPK